MRLKKQFGKNVSRTLADAYDRQQVQYESARSQGQQGNGTMVKQIGMFVLAIVIGFALRSAVERFRGYRTERWFTSDTSTGYFWNDLTHTEKNIYVRGALETLIMSISNGANISLPAEGTAEGTFNGFRDGLDQFYAEPANTPVPVNFAVDFIRLKGTATSKEALEERLVRARAVSNEAAKSQKTQGE